jgi:hypothetical protein
MVHDAVVRVRHTVTSVTTGAGPHIEREYPKKADAVIPMGAVVALDAGEAVVYDPAGALPIKGVATLNANADEPGISLCVLGRVRADLLTVSGGAAPDAATLAKLEERHIYAEESV